MANKIGQSKLATLLNTIYTLSKWPKFFNVVVTSSACFVSQRGCTLTLFTCYMNNFSQDMRLRRGLVSQHRCTLKISCLHVHLPMLASALRPGIVAQVRVEP